MISIAVSRKGQAARVALLKSDDLAEYSIWYFDRPGDVGDIYVGRITARVAALAGSFVDLGIATGFLPDSAGAAGLAEGSYFAAEIIRAAQSGKGPRLAALPAQVKHQTGLIRRSLGPLSDLANRYPQAPIFVDDYHLIATLLERCKQSPPATLPARIAYKPVTFDPILEDEVATFAEPNVLLGAGARMHITPAPALTAIDIDAGAASAEKFSKQHAQLHLNISLIPEITRQILLRNLSGAILIDFAGMKSAARPKLLTPLVAALKADPLNPKCLGFSHLGFAEITRPRIRPALHELLK